MNFTAHSDPVALLVIDVQQGLASPSRGQRNNPQAETNMATLLNAWRQRGWPVLHVRHCSTEADSPLRPELPGNAFKAEVEPRTDEPVFDKRVNSAFIGTGLENHLRDGGIERLVIIGLTTDHCVSASTRMASDLGFDVVLVSDATATFERRGFDGRHYSGDEIHRVNLVSLDGEFCEVHATGDIHKNIVAHQVHTQLLFHDGNKQGHPVVIQTEYRSARRSQRRTAGQGLKLDQNRPGSFHAGRHNGSRCVERTLRKKNRRRI